MAHPEQLCLLCPHGFLRPSRPRGPSPRESCVVSSHPRYYSLIRLPDRLPPDFPSGYTRGPWHSWIVLPVYQALPSLSAYLSPVATIHTPGSVSGAHASFFPDTIGHHQPLISLALPFFFHFNRLHVEGSHDAAMFASRCGPRCCSAPVPT